MTIRRAMPVVVAADLPASRDFYESFLGFEAVMDEEGFLMLASPSTPTTQMIVSARDGETMDPGVRDVDISIEVRDVNAAHADAERRSLEIVYPLTDEPWGIRRFFVRDPDGKVINVASHIADLPDR